MMLRRHFKVHRRDSAFFYAILESLEGYACFSTLDDDGSDSAFREVEVWIPLREDGSGSEDISNILDGLRKKIVLIEVA